MRATVLVLVLGWAWLGAGGPPTVVVRLVPGVSALSPGMKTEVGVVLALPEGWHTYWDGLNDSGFPPRIRWDLPAGFTAGDPIWPAPHRYVSAGEILDHVLEGEVVAVVPLTAPADLAPGTDVTLRCRVEWLVCRDVCVPGRGDAQRSLAVAQPADVREDRDGVRLLAAARAAQARLLTAPSPVRWRRDGDILTIEAPGAGRLVLMPRSDSARPVDLLGQGEADGDRLRLALRPEDAGRAVRGVLAVFAAGGAVTNWQLDIPPEEQP
jgi:DsbC/DsbD-like thiol-disulfide interchange protein